MRPATGSQTKVCATWVRGEKRAEEGSEGMRGREKTVVGEWFIGEWDERREEKA